jgi:hypothetical protein
MRLINVVTSSATSNLDFHPHLVLLGSMKVYPENAENNEK